MLSTNKPLHSLSETVQPDLDSMLVAPEKTIEKTVATSAAMALKFSNGTGEYVALLHTFVESQTKLKFTASMDQTKAFAAFRINGLLTKLELTVMPTNSTYKPSPIGRGFTVTKMAATGMQGKLVTIKVTLTKT